MSASAIIVTSALQLRVIASPGEARVDFEDVPFKPARLSNMTADEMLYPGSPEAHASSANCTTAAPQLVNIRSHFPPKHIATLLGVMVLIKHNFRGCIYRVVRLVLFKR